MKTSKTFALIRMEWFGILFLLVFPLIFLGSVLPSLSSGYGMRSLSFGRADTFMAMPIVMGAILIFSSPSTWGANASFRVPPLEFLFSQPISRVRVFWVKSGIYLFACLLAPALLCAYSFTQPTIHLSVPYQPESRAEIKSFFLENFSGAYTEKTKDGEKIVLPSGQVDKSIFGLLMTGGLLLVAQTVAVFTMERKWGYIILFVVMLIWKIGFGELLSAAMTTPSRYEIGVAWIANHIILVALLGGLLTIAVQVVCMCRFCRTEVV